MEKIGYPELCVNKTLLEKYYHGVRKKLTALLFLLFTDINFYFKMLLEISIELRCSLVFIVYSLNSFRVCSLSNDVL